MHPDRDEASWPAGNENKQCYGAEQAMFRTTALLVLHDNIA